MKWCRAVEWWFPRRQCKAVISQTVLRSMAAVARMATPNETGGTLVGSCSPEEAVVKTALPVTRGGLFARNQFVRPSDDEDPILAKIEARSRGREKYLGEWHSHPYGSVAPSNRDKQTMYRLARSQEVATDTPLLVIVGGDPATSPVFGCYLFEAAVFESGVLPSGSEVFRGPLSRIRWPVLSRTFRCHK